MRCALALLLLLAAAPAAASERTYGDVAGVRLVDCYDGDTCRFDVPDWPPIVGKAIRVRLAGIDAPAIDGDCKAEKRLATAARDVLVGLLEEAAAIELRGLRRGKYFRIVAEVRADSEDVAARLVAAGLARPSPDGRRLDWCATESAMTRP